MDPYLQSEDIARRRQLLAQSMQQTQAAPIVGNTGLGQALAKLGTTYFQKQNMDDLQAQEGQAKEAQGQVLAQGLDKFLTTSQGAPGQTLTDGQAGALMNDNVDPGHLNDPVAANPRRAAIEALASASPELRDIGKQTLTKITTPKGSSLEVKDLLGMAGKYDPKSVLSAAMLAQQGGNPLTALQPVDPAEEGTWGAPMPIPGTRGPDGQPLTGIQNSKTKDIKMLGGGGVNVTTNIKNGDDAAGKEFAKTIGEATAKRLDKSLEGATSAGQALVALKEAGQALDSGIKSGISGPIALQLAKVGQALGIGNGDPSIANTEVFQTSMAKEVANMVKNFGSGTGISDADRMFAEKAAGGDIRFDPASLSRLVKIAMVGAANTINNHNTFLEKTQSSNPELAGRLDVYKAPLEFQAPEGVGFDPTYRRFKLDGATPVTNPAALAPAGKKPSVSNW